MGIEFIPGRPDLDVCSVRFSQFSQFSPFAIFAYRRHRSSEDPSDREVLGSFDSSAGLNETCRADYSLPGPIADFIRVVLTP